MQDLMINRDKCQVVARLFPLLMDIWHFEHKPQMIGIFRYLKDSQDAVMHSHEVLEGALVIGHAQEPAWTPRRLHNAATPLHVDEELVEVNLIHGSQLLACEHVHRDCVSI